MLYVTTIDAFKMSLFSKQEATLILTVEHIATANVIRMVQRAEAKGRVRFAIESPLAAKEIGESLGMKVTSGKAITPFSLRCDYDEVLFAFRLHGRPRASGELPPLRWRHLSIV